MSKNTNKTVRADAAPKTVETVQKRCEFEYVVVNLICLFVFLAFGYIAVMSFIQTSTIDPEKYSTENILYSNDIVPLNILYTVGFIAILFALRRFYDFFARVNITIMEIALAALTLTLGLIWIFSVRSVPAADSANIFDAATGAAKDDYTAMQSNSLFYNHAFYKDFSYFHLYPFQLGFVFICEIIYRIFGTDSSMPVQVINVMCVSATYFALARITKLLFKRKSIEFIAILLLMVCFQPILFCTFAYGNIMGMCAAVWATLLLIIVLAVHIVKAKKWQSAVIAAAFILAVLGSNFLIVKIYEARADMQYESGVSQVMYLDMGMQESYMAPGWYTTTGKDIYINSYLVPKLGKGLDVTIADANEVAWEGINRRTEAFGEDFNYTLDFFSKKILSQWNEPTYESIWVSKVKQHEATEEESERLHAANGRISSQQMDGLVKSVYYKSTGQFLELFFNLYMQVIYIMFAAGIYLLFIHKKTNIETVILPLVLLGAFGYHLLFEGKSQYILTYIPLLIPTAAYTFGVMLGGKYEKIRKAVKRINSIPNKFNDN